MVCIIMYNNSQAIQRTIVFVPTKFPRNQKSSNLQNAVMNAVIKIYKPYCLIVIRTYRAIFIWYLSFLEWRLQRNMHKLVTRVCQGKEGTRREDTVAAKDSLLSQLPTGDTCLGCSFTYRDKIGGKISVKSAITSESKEIIDNTAVFKLNSLFFFLFFRYLKSFSVLFCFVFFLFIFNFVIDFMNLVVWLPKWSKWSIYNFS